MTNFFSQHTNPVFIAEIGMNHNGNVDLCCELIRQAKKSGADIAKIQLGWRSAPGDINHITADQLEKLWNYSNYLKIDLMASIITVDALQLSLAVPFKFYKIASRSLVDDMDLVSQVLGLGLPTFVSHGMSHHLPEGLFNSSNVINLWCKSSYPTFPSDLRDAQPPFPARYGHGEPYFGYSDHFLGISACFLALSRGAMVIEKHFTLDKSDTHIRDHALSATPDEFHQLVTLGRELSFLSTSIPL